MDSTVRAVVVDVWIYERSLEELSDRDRKPDDPAFIGYPDSAHRQTNLAVTL